MQLMVNLETLGKYLLYYRLIFAHIALHLEVFYLKMCAGLKNYNEHIILKYKLTQYKYKFILLSGLMDTV